MTDESLDSAFPDGGLSKDLLDAVAALLRVPVGVQIPGRTLEWGITGDITELTCGCWISYDLYKGLAAELPLGCVKNCPVCGSKDVYKRDKDSRVQQLKDLHRSWTQYVSNKTVPQLNISPDHMKNTSSKLSLMQLFHEVSTKILHDQPNAPETLAQIQKTTNAIENRHLDSNLKTPNQTFTAVSSTASIPTSLAPTSSPSLGLAIAPVLSGTVIDENKELYYAQCFPRYRRKSRFNTHQKILKTRSNSFIGMAISPDCQKFVLLTLHRWEVYTIGNNDTPGLLFCGRNDLSFGTQIDKLKTPRKSLKGNVGLESFQNNNWDHLFCTISNDFLIISGTKSIFAVYSFAAKGAPIYVHQALFPIRCMDIASNSEVLAYSITGRDKVTGSEQGLIVFHKIEHDGMTSTPNFGPPITITLPYRDPINTIHLSDDGLYVTCSTALESRFLVISLKKFDEPRLVMKSLRSFDTSFESEGITDVKLFHGNPNLMCVTSTAFNSPPIVMNTRINTAPGISVVAQPTLLMRLDELGSRIHGCAISPRNDSIAFIDRNGTVCIMAVPTMVDPEKKRVVVVDVVADASRAREAAAMQFSPDGYKLYILDRKGVLHVEDFAFAPPKNRQVIKCKQIV